MKPVKVTWVDLDQTEVVEFLTLVDDPIEAAIIAAVDFGLDDDQLTWLTVFLDEEQCPYTLETVAIRKIEYLG